MRKLPLLSKSRYMAGLQCGLRLWNECYERRLATPPDRSLLRLFDLGHRVGRSATAVFDGGVMIDADHRHFDDALRATARAMEDDAVSAIFEGAFEHERVRVRVDVLERTGDTWALHEVKAAGRVYPSHLRDLALQRWVVEGTGVRVSCATIMTPRRSWWVHNASGRAHFRRWDRTAETAVMASEIGRRVAAMHALLAAPSAPDVPLGLHCRDPYPCPFLDHCARPPRARSPSSDRLR